MQIEFDQTIEKADYKKAFLVHLKNYRITKYRPYIAAMTLANGVYFVQKDELFYLGILSLFLGVYLLFKNRILVSNSLKSSATSNYFEKPIKISISDDFLELHVLESSNKTKLSELYGYKQYDEGLLVYLQRNMFILILNACLPSAQNKAEIMRRLEDLGVEEWKHTKTNR